MSTITPTMATSPYAGEISTLRAPSSAVNPNVRIPTSLLADSRSKPTSIPTASAMAILIATVPGGNLVTS